MKIVYSHFHEDGRQGDKFVIENFLGERSPRSPRSRDTKIVVKGNDVVLTGPMSSCRPDSGQHQYATKIGAPRVFQDGIYITEGQEGGS